MDGKQFVATVRLSTKENETLALPGETCERVPTESLEWLVAQGLVILRVGAIVSVPIRETTQPGDEYRSFEPDGPPTVQLGDQE